MKIKVINSYRDKITKIVHQPGEELEVADERGLEIIAAGNYAVSLEDKKQQKSKNEETQSSNKKTKKKNK